MASPQDAWKCNAEFLKAVQFISEDHQEEVRKLIKDLGLVFLGVEKIVSEENNEPPSWRKMKKNVSAFFLIHSFCNFVEI